MTTIKKCRHRNTEQYLFQQCGSRLANKTSLTDSRQQSNNLSMRPATRISTAKFGILCVLYIKHYVSNMLRIQALITISQIQYSIARSYNTIQYNIKLVTRHM